jgi:hypothetical protein
MVEGGWESIPGRATARGAFRHSLEGAAAVAHRTLAQGAGEVGIGGGASIPRKPTLPKEAVVPADSVRRPKGTMNLDSVFVMCKSMILDYAFVVPKPRMNAVQMSVKKSK